MKIHKKMPWLLAALLIALATAPLAAPFAYVPYAGGAAVIDTQTGNKIADIALDGNPEGIAMLPGGRNAYLSNGVDRIWVVDTVAHAMVSTIAVGAPFHVAMNPNPARSRAYVITGSAPAATDITVINTDNHSAVPWVSVPGTPSKRIAFNPAGTRLFLSTGSSITYLPASDEVPAPAAVVNIPIPGAQETRGMAVHPARNFMYVAIYGGVAPGNSVAVIDLGTNAYQYSIPVGQRPSELAISPDGARLYVLNEQDNTVSVIATGSNGLVATIPVGRQPSAIDITPNGDAVYVVSALDNTVSVIATDTLAVKTIGVGAGPRGSGRFIGGVSFFDPPGPLSGLWWNPAERGWGLQLAQRRNTVFAAWFTYDASGKSRWYVASNCAVNPPLACPLCVDNTACSGPLYEVTGPRFFEGPFDTSLLKTTAIGTLNLAFSNRDNATMTWDLAGKSGSSRISRQVFQGGTIAPFTDYSDFWFNPRESGWGLGVTHQYGVMFLAWFVYDAAGQPVWYAASNCAVIASGNGCTGSVYRTSGPRGPVSGARYDPAPFTVKEAGTVSVSFSDPSSGMISYTVDGVSGIKPLTRQSF
jgi:YVTN family beta-propeller protein